MKASTVYSNTGNRKEEDFLFPNFDLTMADGLLSIYNQESNLKPYSFFFFDLTDSLNLNAILNHTNADRIHIDIDELIANFMIETQGHYAHLGGFQYLAVVPDINSALATSIAKNFYETINRILQVYQLDCYLEASVGIACSPAHGNGFNKLVCSSYLANINARVSKTGVQVYRDNHMESMNRHARILNSMSRELLPTEKKPSFSMVYQPKISLASGDVTGAEALIRWKHTTMGEISPTEFIPVIEKTQLMNHLTFKVLNLVLSDLQSLISEGCPTSMAVNISANDLSSPNFSSRVINMLRQYNIPPHLLELEITETSLLSNIKEASSQLIALREGGVKISIDDFGTGFSSLSYLTKLPVNFLKIDASLIKNMIFSQRTTVIVQSMIEMAKKLTLEVIAEGVENQSTLNRLASMECEMAQGFYLSQPLPVSSLEAFIRFSSVDKYQFAT